MYEACKKESFPSIETMSKFGLTGYQGTNPVAIFDCYKRAIANGITADQLENSSDLNDLILKCPGVSQSPYFDAVISGGGIKVAPRCFECLRCGSCTCTSCI